MLPHPCRVLYARSLVPPTVTERTSGRAHNESRWYVLAIYAWPNYVLYSLLVRTLLIIATQCVTTSCKLSRLCSDHIVRVSEMSKNALVGKYNANVLKTERNAVHRADTETAYTVVPSRPKPLGTVSCSRTIVSRPGSPCCRVLRASEN